MATVGDDQIISSETVTVEANAKKQPRECDARDEEQENDEDIHKLLLNEAHAILSRAPAVADGEAASQLILYQPPPGTHAKCSLKKIFRYVYIHSEGPEAVLHHVSSIKYLQYVRVGIFLS